MPLLPQPFVTSVLTQNSDVRVALGLTEEWDKAVEGQSGLTMGCVVVRSEFAENNKEALDSFLDEYKASVETVTSEEGLSHAAELSEKYDIMKSSSCTAGNSGMQHRLCGRRRDAADCKRIFAGSV